MKPLSQLFSGISHLMKNYYSKISTSETLYSLHHPLHMPPEHKIQINLKGNKVKQRRVNFLRVSLS